MVFPQNLQLLYTPAVQPDDTYKHKYANVLFIAELSSTIQLPCKCEPIQQSCLHANVLTFASLNITTTSTQYAHAALTQHYEAS